jgi:hypothetical protein
MAHIASPALPLKVIQCGTGIAGVHALTAILDRPDLSLAGLLVHSEQNENRDAASFISRPDCGVRATRSVAALARVEADIVLYMLLVPSLDDICTFLASGKDVVTTAGFMFPRWNNQEAHRRLSEACAAGGSSFFVTGINPGFVDEVLPLTMSFLARDWKTISISEYADCSTYPSAPMLYDVMGFGRTPEDIAAGRVADMRIMTDFFAASVAALAHELGLTLDEVRQSRELLTASEPFDISVGRIERGTVAGQRWRWAGVAGGVERIVQETYWIVGFDLAEGWPRRGEMSGDVRWQVTIEGSPSLRCVFETRESFDPDRAPTGTNASSVATAMAGVNSLQAVAAAPIGLLTAADLSQPRWRGA